MMWYKVNERELKYWALLKWRWNFQHYNWSNHRYTNRERLLKKYPKLRNLKCACSYCNFYDYDNNQNGCPECPLSIKGIGGCVKENHPFDNWNNYKSKKNCKKVLNLILNVKVSRKKLFFRRPNENHK